MPHTHLLLLKVLVDLLESVVCREHVVETKQNLSMGLDKLFIDWQHDHILQHDVTNAMSFVASTLPHHNAMLQVTQEDRVVLDHRVKVIKKRLQVLNVFRCKHLAKALQRMRIELQSQFIGTLATYRIDNIKIPFVGPFSHQNFFAKEISFVGWPLLLQQIAISVQRAVIAVRLCRYYGCRRRNDDVVVVVVENVLLIIAFCFCHIVCDGSVARRSRLVGA